MTLPPGLKGRANGLLLSLPQEEDCSAGSRLGTVLGSKLRRLTYKGLFIQVCCGGATRAVQ